MVSGTGGRGGIGCEGDSDESILIIVCFPSNFRKIPQFSAENVANLQKNMQNVPILAVGWAKIQEYWVKKHKKT